MSQGRMECPGIANNLIQESQVHNQVTLSIYWLPVNPFCWAHALPVSWAHHELTGS